VNLRAGLDLPLLALVLGNLLPVFGVLYLGWDVGSIVVLYWAENLIIGGYTILKLLVAGRLRALFPALFFCVHYGGFCAVHGMSVLQLTGYADTTPAQPASWPFPLLLVELFIGLARRVLEAAPPEFLWACIALLVSHGASFLLLFIGRQEYRNATANTLMKAPYKRVAVLHVAVIAGGFLVQRLGSPLGLLLALVAIKIVMDISLHRRSHAAAAGAAAGAGPAADTGKPPQPAPRTDNRRIRMVRNRNRRNARE
jgi:Family of unknown function (DUF6498)